MSGRNDKHRDMVADLILLDGDGVQGEICSDLHQDSHEPMCSFDVRRNDGGITRVSIYFNHACPEGAFQEPPEAQS